VNYEGCCEVLLDVYMVQHGLLQSLDVDAVFLVILDLVSGLQRM